MSDYTISGRAGDEWKEEARRDDPEPLKGRPRTDPDTKALRRAIKENQKQKPAAPRGVELPPRSPSPTYVDLEGKVWDGHAWHRRDAKWWQSRARRAIDDRILEVGDVGGATTIEVGKATWIRRGCLIDGNPEVVHDKVTIGKWADGPWRGGLCITCHKWWTEASISSKRSYDGLGKWVTSRLADEGYLPGAKLERQVHVTETHSKIEVYFLQGWPSKCWAYRVLAAGDPSTQEPPKTAFGFLSGPLRVPEPEEVTA